MTLQQYNEHGKFKMKFKCIIKSRVAYTLAKSLEQCKAKFTGCLCEEVTEEEFLSNYVFTN